MVPDEDETDESCKAFLREAGNVAHVSGHVEHHQKEEDQRGPDADPHPEAQEVDIKLSANKFLIQYILYTVY